MKHSSRFVIEKRNLVRLLWLGMKALRRITNHHWLAHSFIYGSHGTHARVNKTYQTLWPMMTVCLMTYHFHTAKLCTTNVVVIHQTSAVNAVNVRLRNITYFNALSSTIGIQRTSTVLLCVSLFVEYSPRTQWIWTNQINSSQSRNLNKLLWRFV